MLQHFHVHILLQCIGIIQAGTCWAWWNMPLMPALGGLRQESSGPTWPRMFPDSISKQTKSQKPTSLPPHKKKKSSVVEIILSSLFYYRPDFLKGLVYVINFYFKCVIYSILCANVHLKYRIEGFSSFSWVY